MISGIKGYIKSSFVDWPKQICSVLFLNKCNFRCFYCHNIDIVLDKTKDLNFGKILAELKKRQNMIDHICISGGEPTFNESRLLNLLNILKKENFKIKVDTNGYNPKVIKNIIDQNLIDFISMDVKAPLSSEKYSIVAQREIDIERIINSLFLIKESGIDFELRTTYDGQILTLNDINQIKKDLIYLGFRDFRYKIQEARINKKLFYSKLSYSARETFRFYGRSFC